ncbi:MAG TPA: hypothetical protein VHX52_08855 [Steroidobacteraceae bacterium]|jgi:hypothetical protein|nr:hypothetical protein [Steroidobacteraceae bacterium]
MSTLNSASIFAPRNNRAPELLPATIPRYSPGVVIPKPLLSQGLNDHLRTVLSRP